jgi:hypothetical protein
VPHAAQLFLRLEQNKPVLRTEHLETVIIVNLIKAIDVFRVDLFLLASEVEYFFFFFLFLQLDVFLCVVLYSNKIEDIGEKGMFDLAIHG